MEWLSRIFVDIPALRPGSAGSYAFAVLCVAAALALNVVLSPHILGGQYLPFFPAVIITTLTSGVAAGLFALLLSVAAVAFFLMPPIFSFGIASTSDVATTVLFILVTATIVVLLAGMRGILEHCRDLGRRLAQHEMELRDREDRLSVMVAELQHRTRNLISVVSAIADDTLRASKSLDDFKTSYHERLAVLGRAQGLLFRNTRGGPVTFDDLLDSELAAQSVPVGDNARVTLDGPRGVQLRSGTVQTLAMVLHELVTNAIKHGALAHADGYLRIRWHRKDSLDNGRPWLHIDWKESGLAIPTRAATGRGRELIERALPYQCDARTTFTLEPDGVHCTISITAGEDTPVGAPALPEQVGSPPLAPP